MPTPTEPRGAGGLIWGLQRRLLVLLFLPGGLADVVYVGRQIQSDIFNGSGLVAGAILFLIVTIPLARLVDYLIAREQRRTKRSGESNDSDQLEETQPAGGLPPNSGDLS